MYLKICTIPLCIGEWISRYNNISPKVVVVGNHFRWKWEWSYFWTNFSYHKFDILFNNACVTLADKFAWVPSLSKKLLIIVYVLMLAKLFRNVVPKFPYLADNKSFPSLYTRLSTIEKSCFINHHIPTTFGCHGYMFGYVLDRSFTYTMVSAKFL